MAHSYDPYAPFMPLELGREAIAGMLRPQLQDQNIGQDDHPQRQDDPLQQGWRIVRAFRSRRVCIYRTHRSFHGTAAFFMLRRRMHNIRAATVDIRSSRVRPNQCIDLRSRNLNFRERAS
jgi:hypothetical protein